MKEFLSEKRLNYEELNVAEDAAARDEMLKKTGRMAVPTILVDEHVIIGFNRSELERLLQ